MLQLHLACEQRIGVILVGPSGSGKSTLWQMLEDAYALLGSRPVVYRLNPKAMPRQQLLGSLNLDTREWTDGVLTAAARKVHGLIVAYVRLLWKSYCSMIVTRHAGMINSCIYVASRSCIASLALCHCVSYMPSTQ
jgi:energy-coupling factor transporter ATP-binding protein EcfA2